MIPPCKRGWSHDQHGQAIGVRIICRGDEEIYNVEVEWFCDRHAPLNKEPFEGEWDEWIMATFDPAEFRDDWFYDDDIEYRAWNYNRTGIRETA